MAVIAKAASGRNRSAHTINARGRAAIRAQLLAVYDGQTLIGQIDDHGRGSVAACAIRNDRRSTLGNFPNRAAAMRAIGREVGKTEDAPVGASRAK
jgi:hypothetical protein